MTRTAPLATLLALAVGLWTAPALASPNCLMSGGSGVQFSIQIGHGKFTKSELEQFDKMRLRQAGIDADRVQRTWLECLKVTRRDGQGHWVTEYYDPQTLELKPLDLRPRW